MQSHKRTGCQKNATNAVMKMNGRIMFWTWRNRRITLYTIIGGMTRIYTFKKTPASRDTL
jgi:hypothetical protein